MPVADEVYLLYPEDPGNLARVSQNPAHLLFKKFGESMPRGDWHHPGTKQGIYMMGPDGEYLEGRFAASGQPEDIKARLRRAMDRWKTLKAQKGYAELPIPSVKAQIPPGINGELVLRINSRDLPRGPGDQSGRRMTDADRAERLFTAYTQWAWNENWVGVSSAADFMPSSEQWVKIPDNTASNLLRRALIDNVRGQVQEWAPNQIVRLSLLKRWKPRSQSSSEFQGDVRFEAPGRWLELKLYGTGKWNGAKRNFDSLELAAVGIRAGRGQFNRRENDPGPAPIGFAITAIPR